MVLYGLTKNCGCDKSLKKGVFFRLSPTLNVWFQKMSKLPPQKGWEIPDGGGVSEIKTS